MPAFTMLSAALRTKKTAAATRAAAASACQSTSRTLRSRRKRIKAVVPTKAPKGPRGGTLSQRQASYRGEKVPRLCRPSGGTARDDEITAAASPHWKGGE